MNAGINAPFATAKPSVALTSSEEQALVGGQTVMRQVLGADGKGGRALAVQDVAATADTVWSRILAFPEYPKMVAGVQECSNYDTKTHRNGTRTIKTRMKLGVMGVKLEYFVEHTFAPQLGVLTWTLDYTRQSDLIDSVGYWCVVPHPTKPGTSRVYYSVDAALPGWVPGFVVNAVTKKALTDATSWVKVESEKAQAGSQLDASSRSCGWSWKRWRWRCVAPPPRPPEHISLSEQGAWPTSVASAAVGVLLLALFFVFR